MAGIIAAGNDLVFIPDFKKSLNSAFKKRVFTRLEIEQIEDYRANPLIRYASTWAAKEAVLKALKQIFPPPLQLKWQQIEIRREQKIPRVKIAKAPYNKLAYFLSLSHDGDYAVAALVVTEGKKR